MWPNNPTKKYIQNLMNFFRENEDILTQYPLFMFIFQILAIFRTKKNRSWGYHRNTNQFFIDWDHTLMVSREETHVHFR
jgi:hypothetical protein